MKIVDKKQYHLKDYKSPGYGYQKVIIPEDLYDLINEYIEEAHSMARELKYDNYYKNTIADRVSSSDDYEDENYYVLYQLSRKTPFANSMEQYSEKNLYHCRD